MVVINPRPAGSAAPAARRGKQPTALQQRQERAFAAALVFALVFLVGLGTALGWGAGQAAALVREIWPGGAPPLVSDKTAVPEPMDISGPSTACPASSLEVSLAASRERVLPGQLVDFEITVTHVGRWPCLVDGGEGNRAVTITDDSGAVRWTSKHCPSAGSLDLLLGPGDSFTRRVTWSGRASVPDACTEGQPFVDPGRYFAQASLPGVAHSNSARVPVTMRERLPQTPPPFPPPGLVPPPPAEPANNTEPAEYTAPAEGTEPAVGVEPAESPEPAAGVEPENGAPTEPSPPDAAPESD